MTGTLINVGAVLLGGGVGLLFGPRLPDRVRDTVITGLGLFTMAVGFQLFLRGVGVEGENPLIPLAGLLVGGVLGEWWRIERKLKQLGEWLEAKTAGRNHAGDAQRFVRGFLSSSLLFCIGPMTILGAIQDGLSGDYQLLAIKSVLDGFASLALASTLGVGVLFSVLVVFSYQGGLSLLAAQAQAFLSPLVLAELSTVGGILLLALAVGTLLELRPIRAGNLLPGLAVAPLLRYALDLLGQ